MKVCSAFAVGLLSLAFCVADSLRAEQWPQFRGPTGDGVATGAECPSEWSVENRLAWRVKIEGAGWSAPIVVADKIFLTTTSQTTGGDSSQENFELHCLELATGKTVWKEVVLTTEPRIERHRDNTYATETPVTDGERIYAYFGMHGLYCYDLTGQQLWKRDLGAFEMANGWGASSSPVVSDGLVFLQIDNEEESFVVALDGKTGDERWKDPRPEERSNWSTPFVWRNNERTELITSGAKVISYDPSTGRRMWWFDNPGRSSATPIGNRELLLVGAEDRSDRGEGRGGLYAVKPGAKGDITPGEEPSSHILWENPRAALGIASPLLYEGCVYVPNRRGGLVGCYDAATGKELYRRRLPGNREFWASPWAQGGKVFLLDDRGSTHVLAAGPEFEVLGRNELAGRFWASTAVADGRVLLRSEEELFCIQ